MAKLTIIFEYDDLESEEEARAIRDQVSPLVHDAYKVDTTPSAWFWDLEGRFGTED